jgi:hypothetical protein
MATKKSRLAEIYKAEKARGGGIASTLGKRALEKIDPRQFFNQEGFLAAIMPSLFKAYKVDTKMPSAGSLAPTAAPAVQTAAMSDFSNELQVIKIDTKISAKNSMVLPAMARDMNLMRQNVAKLVKIQGGTPTNKADMFFKRASERESEYESKFKKESKKTPTTAPTQTTTGQTTGKSGLLGGLLGGLGKGLGIASVGVGIAGFLTALGGAAFVLNQVGGASGLKDMLVNLAEGLSAFSGQSLIALGALLGTGMLFGSVTGLKTKAGAALGITAIGLGIGGFLAGLSAGGALSDMIGGSTGVRDMLVNLAEGLGAFNTTGIAALGGLLGAGALFGVVGSLGGAKVAVGANIGIGAIGFAIGAFLTGLSAGGAGVEFFGGSSGIKDILVNTAEGLSAFGNVDATNLLKLAGVLPLFGAGMLAFFGMKGLGSLVDSIGQGLTKVVDFIFGSKNEKSPMTRLSEELKLFDNINGENLSKVGQGLKDLAAGMSGLSNLSKSDIEKATAAARVASSVTPGTPQAATTTTPAPVTSNVTEETFKRLGVTPSTAGGGRGSINPPNVSPTPVSGVLDLIASGEAISKDPYNSMNQGTPGGKISGSGVSANIIGQNLTDMTVGEILSRAPNASDNAEERKQKGAVFAAGRYQIIPKTLQGLVDQGVVSKDEKFTPEVQDRLALKLVEQSGATKSINEGDLDKAQYQLAKVWASLPVPAGMTLKSGEVSTGVESFYGGANKAKEGLTLASLQLPSATAAPTMTMASAKPTTGATITAATTEVEKERIQLASAPIVVTAPSVNVQQSQPNRMPQSINQPSVVDSEFMKLLVGRTVTI